MVDVTRTFEVDRTPEAVIDYLKDFSRAEEWDPGTVSCTRVDDGPVVVGARWHNVSQFLGRETELEYELTELSGEGVVFRGRNATATSTDEIRVEPSGDGARITYHARIEFSGVARFAGPLLQLVFERIGDKTETQMTSAINGS